MDYIPSTVRVEAVEVNLRDWDYISKILKQNLQRAQERMKKYYDLRRKEQEYAEGEWVYLRLQSYQQTSVALCRNLKLAPSLYRPFQIRQMIGKDAY